MGDDLLYRFKLERCMDYGPVIAACFASQDKAEIDTIRKVIIHCIKYSLKELKQINNNTTTGNHNMNQSMPSSSPPPIAFTSSYDENQLHQQQQTNHLDIMMIMYLIMNLVNLYLFLNFKLG